MRHATEEVKGLDMALEEGFLLLEREGDHETRLRVIQPHHEELHRHPLAGQLDHGLAPVHLGILARVELQRQKRRPGFARPALLADVARTVTSLPA